MASGEDLSGYADLRALLPDKVGEVALTKSLFTGEEFEAAPESVSDQMRALLQGLGRGPRDLAMAIAGEQTGAADLTITAFRVRDIQADEFFAAYVPLVKEAFPSAAINETVLGGKTVYDVSLDGQAAGTTYLYPRDDVLFIVTGSDLELVNLAFAALP